jgi:hypothetical protein
LNVVVVVVVVVVDPVARDERAINDEKLFPICLKCKSEAGGTCRVEGERINRSYVVATPPDAVKMP